MRRTPRYLEEEIDDALHDRDPLLDLAGSIDAEPADVDDVVYGLGGQVI